jgi:hypothetical protein
MLLATTGIRQQNNPVSNPEHYNPKVRVKLHNEEHSLYTSLNSIMEFKKNTMRWEAPVARMGLINNTYTIGED